MRRFFDPELERMARIAALLDANMIGQVSTTGASYALQVIFGQAVAGLITARNVFVALLTADPGVAPTSTATALASEVGVGGYARQQLASSAPSGNPEQLQNTSLITFGPFTAAPASPITFAALVSTLTGTTGDFLYKWQLTDSGNNPTPKSPGVNDTVQIAFGALTASMQ